MSAFQTLVQGVLALSQALAVGGVGRAIVELLLTERGAGLCFHGGIDVVALQRSRRWERLRMQGRQTKHDNGGRRGSTKPYEARLCTLISSLLVGPKECYLRESFGKVKGCWTGLAA